jgi:hypothetical protein
VNEVQQMLADPLLARCKELVAEHKPTRGSTRGIVYFGHAAAGLEMRWASAIVRTELWMEDGTGLVFTVTGHVTSRSRGAWKEADGAQKYVYDDSWHAEDVEVRTDGPSVDSADAFWARTAEEDKTRKFLVIDGKHYVVEPDITNQRSLAAGCAGFGGRLFRHRLKGDTCVCDHTYGAHWPGRKDNDYKGECDGDLKGACAHGFHRMERPVYETRNLWYQGPVPPAHRAKFPDNAEFIGDER